MIITPCNYNYKQKVSFEKVIPLIGESEQALKTFEAALTKKVGKKYADKFSIQPLGNRDYDCLTNCPQDNLHQHVAQNKRIVHLLLTDHNAVTHRLDVQAPLGYRDHRPLYTWEEHELDTAARLVATDKKFRRIG